MKILAKMHRMNMLTEVKEFVESLPFKIVEKQMDRCVYAGIGEVDTGTKKYQTCVRIIPKNGKLWVSVISKGAGIDEEIPFSTEKQQEDAKEAVKNLMGRYLN